MAPSSTTHDQVSPGSDQVAPEGIARSLEEFLQGLDTLMASTLAAQDEGQAALAIRSIGW